MFELLYSKCAEIRCYGNAVKFVICCNHCELKTDNFKTYQTHYCTEHLLAKKSSCNNNNETENTINTNDYNYVLEKDIDDDVASQSTAGSEWQGDMFETNYFALEDDDEQCSQSAVKTEDIDETCTTTETQIEIELDVERLKDIEVLANNATPTKAIERKKQKGVNNQTKGFRCQHCNKIYSSKTNCKSHELRHTNRSGFPCDLCTKAFCSRSELRNHIRSHTNERAFVCEKCGNGFRHSWVLRKHQRIHIDQPKTIPCPLCDKLFAFDDNLRSHMQIHNTEAIFVCDICNEAFTMRKKLRLHKQKRHKTKVQTKTTTTTTLCAK